MQARARSVGRGGASFRGKNDKLELGRQRRRGSGAPDRTKEDARPTGNGPSCLGDELARAREEIVRQSRLLAELAVEAELARAAVRELAAQRTRLLSALCHDLRTPLNAVIGFSDVMHREMHGPLGHQRYRDYAGHIRDSGALLLATAERLLADTPFGHV